MTRAISPSGLYRGTSLTRKRTPLGPYRRSMPSALGGSQRGGRFLMGEVPLYSVSAAVSIFTHVLFRTPLYVLRGPVWLLTLARAIRAGESLLTLSRDSQYEA